MLKKLSQFSAAQYFLLGSIISPLAQVRGTPHYNNYSSNHEDISTISSIILMIFIFYNFKLSFIRNNNIKDLKYGFLLFVPSIFVIFLWVSIGPIATTLIAAFLFIFLISKFK